MDSQDTPYLSAIVGTPSFPRTARLNRIGSLRRRSAAALPRPCAASCAWSSAFAACANDREAPPHRGQSGRSKSSKRARLRARSRSRLLWSETGKADVRKAAEAAEGAGEDASGET